MICNERTEQALELDAIRKMLTARCRTQLGVRHFLELRPLEKHETLQRHQRLLRSYIAYREHYGELPWDNSLESVERLLGEAQETGLLTGQELLKIRRLLHVAEQLRKRIRALRDEYPDLQELGRALNDYGEDLQALGILDDDGRLYDSASPRLAEIRGRLESMRRTTRSKGQRILSSPEIQQKLQERVLTLRDGRFAVLVRQEHAGTFPGIALERSGSGNSVYMEPKSLVPLNNSMALLQREEQQEERRILGKLTRRLIGRIAAIGRAEGVLGRLDGLYGAVDCILQSRWTIPELTEHSRIDLRNAVHPQLRTEPVPIDIHVGRGFGQLVITGPNTGGKTVALKTLGIALFLAWCGLPVPAAEGSVVGDFDRVEADIGDEQSIEQNLSTFSGHMTAMISILENATEHSLVLLDELGAGTDPQEGAAIGIAVLEELRRRGTRCVATTHHNPIKRYSLVTADVETASVEFNPDTLSPTYRLLIGIPGKSNALNIARKLGFPSHLLDEAVTHLEGEEGSIEELISELQEKQTSLNEREREVEERAAQARQMKENYEQKVHSLEEKKEAIIAGADRRAKRIVREAEEGARRLMKEMEEAGRAGSLQKARSEGSGGLKRVEKQIDQREDQRKTRKSSAGRGEAIGVGDRVRLVESKVEGEVERINNAEATVLVGGMRVQVPLKRLERQQQSGGQEGRRQERAPVHVQVARPAEQVPASLSVRGMNLAESIPLVEQYLDKAYRYGYDTVTIIHGRGKGILRKEVQKLCKQIPYVAEYRLGGPGEGGYGVTVVRFRR